MQLPSAWWIAAGVAVALELGTRTLYGLAIALGLAAGALAAHGGLTLAQQVIVAVLVAAAAAAALHWRRASAAARASRGPPRPVDSTVQPAIGERVQVAEWTPQRTARVEHRGSPWLARLEAGAPAAPGAHVIVGLEGDCLVLAPFAGHEGSRPLRDAA